MLQSTATTAIRWTPQILTDLLPGGALHLQQQVCALPMGALTSKHAVFAYAHTTVALVGTRTSEYLGGNDAVMQAVTSVWQLHACASAYYISGTEVCSCCVLQLCGSFAGSRLAILSLTHLLPGCQVLQAGSSPSIIYPIGRLQFSA